MPETYEITATVKHGATVIVKTTRTATLEEAVDACVRLFPGGEAAKIKMDLVGGSRLTEVFSPSEKSDVLTVVTVAKKRTK